MNNIQAVLFKNIDDDHADQILKHMKLKKIKPYHYTDKYTRARIIKPDHEQYYYWFIKLKDQPFDLIVQHLK